MMDQIPRRGRREDIQTGPKDIEDILAGMKDVEREGGISIYFGVDVEPLSKHPLVLLCSVPKLPMSMDDAYALKASLTRAIAQAERIRATTVKP